jgi:hypothetical protein
LKISGGQFANKLLESGVFIRSSENLPKVGREVSPLEVNLVSNLSGN